MSDALLAHRPRLNPIAGPILGEFLLTLTVAFAGLWLASHESDAAGGAFGMVAQMQETMYVVFRVLAIGLGVVITQALGGGQVDAARRTALGALGASTWAGLLVVASLLIGDDWALEALNAPDEVKTLAGPFLMLLAPAMLLDAYNLSMAAILRAHLHVKESLRVMVVMHVTHLVLAFVLMRGIGGWDGWGLNGYAVAMIVSRAIGLVLHLALWKRLMRLEPTPRDWVVVHWRLVRPVLWIGGPGAVVEVVYRAMFMVSLASTARLGVEALATHAYTLQILKYVLLVSNSIGWATEIMVGRMVGAGELKKADALVRKGVRNGLLASGGLALMCALAAPWLMHAFTKDPAIVHSAQVLLWLSVLLETGRVFNLVLNGALRATGDAIFPAVSCIASLLLVLGLGSFWMGRWFGLPGIWLVYASDEWIRGMLILWRWLKRGWLAQARSTQRRVRGSAS
ncbi:MATE family efflux transporter [Paucibacter sp. R3-3]|uniref:MATE family efflux transporter n=1 Tax=Roseateles agri TaxID=3098619 RepID=A0ABU5DQM5_9BURK|nr:MATE family efflux transporter [Paucibacter sp. R3-3]MDY0748628.1 MATE family efflux transporter [Paucibacter sp. R3-3]